MIATTHIFFAQLCLAFTSIGDPKILTPENALACAIGSLSPDLDNSKSWLGRILPFMSNPIEKKFGHRTLLHSIFAIITLTIITALTKTIDPKVFHLTLTFTIGYISHIILDTTSIQGVKILYPLSMRNAVFPFDTQNPTAYRIQVGSKADLILGFVFLALTIPTAIISSKTYKKTIREIQADINSAIRTFNEIKTNYIAIAEIDATENITGKQLKGNFLIIDAIDKNTAVIRAGNRIITVGKDPFKDDYTAHKIIIQPIKHSTLNVLTLHIANQSLSSALPIKAPDTLIFISGKITFAEKPPTETETDPVRFKTIELKDKTATLKSTPLDIIKKLNLNNLIIEEGNITIKFYAEEPLAEIPTQTQTQKEKNTITFDFKLNENPIITKKIGDQVKRGEPLIIKQTQSAEILNLEIQKIKISIAEKQNLLITLERKLIEDTLSINDELKKIEEEIMKTKEKAEKGIVSPKEVEKLTYDHAKISAKKRILLLNYQERAGKINAEIEKLKIDLAVKETKLRNTSTYIPSPEDGTITDIKETTTTNKKQIKITLTIPIE